MKKSKKLVNSKGFKIDRMLERKDFGFVHITFPPITDWDLVRRLEKMRDRIIKKK